MDANYVWRRLEQIVTVDSADIRSLYGYAVMLVNDTTGLRVHLKSFDTEAEAHACRRNITRQLFDALTHDLAATTTARRESDAEPCGLLTMADLRARS